MNPEIELLQKTLPLSEGVEVIAAHSSGLVALNKPPGIMAHPNSPEPSEQALLTSAYDEAAEAYIDLPESTSAEKVYLLHRLDSATSGVLLISLDEGLARLIRARFAEREVQKVYHAVIKGEPAKHPQIWKDSLKRRGDEGLPRAGVRMQRGGNSLAQTAWKLIKRDGNQLGFSLVEFRPKTGRTHQLRAQCAMRGHPILGDRNYGDFKLNKRMAAAYQTKRLMLHATEIKVRFRHGTEMVEFSGRTPYPEVFDEIMKRDFSRVITFRAGPSPQEVIQKEREQARQRMLGKRR